MAFEVVNYIVEQPEATLVSAYTVHREGKYPYVRISYAEVSRLSKGPFVVSGVKQSSSGSAYDTLIVNGNVSDDLLNGEVVLLSGSGVPLGVVTATDAVSSSISVSSGSIEDITGQSIKINLVSITGSPAWTPIKTGRRWECVLNTQRHEHLLKLNELLDNAYYSAVKTVLDEMGVDTITDEQIISAIQSLSTKGCNLDSFIGQQAENLEKSRRDGSFPYVIVNGNAP